MSPPKKKRVLLGKVGGLGERQRVYAIADGIEIDELDGNEVRRRRVFFDDVLFVTYHRIYGWGFLLVLGAAAGLFSLAGLGFLSAGEGTAAFIFLVFVAGPFWLAFLLRLVFRVDIVTVFGRRTRAEMRFSFRKGRARRVFDSVCRSARRRQEETAAEAEAAPSDVPREMSPEIPPEMAPPAHRPAGGAPSASAGEAPPRSVQAPEDDAAGAVGPSVGPDEPAPSGPASA